MLEVTLIEKLGINRLGNEGIKSRQYMHAC